jgi:hypothetical protein
MVTISAPGTDWELARPKMIWKCPAVVNGKIKKKFEIRDSRFENLESRIADFLAAKIPSAA